jgi:hypothetical protein
MSLAAPSTPTAPTAPSEQNRANPVENMVFGDSCTYVFVGATLRFGFVVVAKKYVLSLIKTASFCDVRLG